MSSHRVKGLDLYSAVVRPSGIGQRRQRIHDRAFTLVELLTVLGIIMLLVSILLPVVSAARASAAAIKCSSNVRQLCLALVNYSVEWKGAFPPYTYDANAGQYMHWCQPDRIGPYISATTLQPALGGDSLLGGPILTCPQDEQSQSSYAMNVWMCSYVDASVIGPPPRGALWHSTYFAQASSIILVAERWSTQSSGGPHPSYYTATPTIGALGTTCAQRFGVDPTFNIGSSRWGRPYCELPYMRHRRKGDGGAGVQSTGRVNIGYVDGHVELKNATDLANPLTQKGTLDTWFSPWDSQQN